MEQVGPIIFIDLPPEVRVTAPWMIARLALETSMHHCAADESRLRGLSMSTLDAYRGFLARIFGFEAVVERTLVPLANRDRAWVQSRMRSELLRSDLRVLGVADTEIAAMPAAPALHIPSFAHGLGWLYVLERHTLLAGLVVRQLERVLGIGISGATRYLGACGERPGAAFSALGDMLGRLATKHAPELMVQGANDAFRAQHQWYAPKPCTPLHERERPAPRRDALADEALPLALAVR